MQFIKNVSHAGLLLFILSSLSLAYQSSREGDGREKVGRETKFLSLTERTSDGENVSLDPDKRDQWIDINSNVAIRFDPALFAISDTKLLDSPESKRLRLKLEGTVKLLTGVRDNLGRYSESVNRLRAELLADKDKKAEELFRESVRAHGKFVTDMIDFLETMGAEEALEQALSEPDPSYLKVIELIEAVLRDLKKQTLELMKDDSILISVWCLHQPKGKDPVRIHLPNYDEIPSGNVNLVDKVSIARSAEEEKYLQENLAFHNEIIRLTRDIGDENSSIRRGFEELRNTFLADLGDLKSLFGTQEIQKLLDEIDQEIRQAASSPAIIALRNDVEALRTGAKGFKELFSLKDLNAALANELQRTEPTPLALFNVLEAKVRQFTALADQLKSKVSPQRLNELKEAITRLQNDLTTHAQNVSIQLRTKIEDFVGSKAPKWIRTFSKIDSIMETYTRLRSFAEQLVTFKDATKIGRKFSEDIQDPGMGTIPLAQAPETSIDITRTIRNEDDIYTLYVKVMTTSSSTLLPSQNLTIRKFGWYSKWVGSLVFAKQGSEEIFKPTTSVSWVLHNRSRRGNGRGILGNVINLGLGLNSAVFASNNNIEYGLGGTITFFNNLLQVGYGINLQRETDRGYVYVGASLFDLLKQDRAE